MRLSRIGFSLFGLFAGLAAAAQHRPHPGGGGHARPSGPGAQSAPAPAPERPGAARPQGPAQESRPRAPRPPRETAPRERPQAPRPHAAPAPRPARERGDRDRARDWQRQRGWRREGCWQGGRSWRDNRAHHWNDEHRDWRARGGYGGYRIPDARFRPWFGPDHFFRLRMRPVIYGGYPRFYYGNYYFLIVDPWPEFWDDDWYARDEVYIVWDDGYYLYNRRHPGVAVAVTVSIP